MYSKFTNCIAVALLVIVSSVASAQNNVVDQIVAKVGGNIILKSEVEERVLEMKAQGQNKDGEDQRCDILKEMLVSKVMLAEAELDTTIIVDDAAVNRELNNSMNRYYEYFENDAAIEKYFKRPMASIKQSLSENIRNMMMIQQIRGKVISDVKVTPAQIRFFYKTLTEDQLPMVPVQVQYAKISVEPKIEDDEVLKVKGRLRELKKRIESGSSFATMAVLYSEGPSSAQGGELPGYSDKNGLDQDFYNAAVALKPGEISNVVESAFGYHIIQLIDKKNTKVKCRHILMRAKVSSDNKEEAKLALDSVKMKITDSTEPLPWDQAAYYYSSDKTTKNNGGVAINQNNMTSKFRYDELDGELSKQISKMSVGDISDPVWTFDERKGTGEFVLVKLTTIIPEHRADIKEDYQMIADMYKEKRITEVFDEWLSERVGKLYVNIDESYSDCEIDLSSLSIQ